MTILLMSRFLASQLLAMWQLHVSQAASVETSRHAESEHELFLVGICFTWVCILWNSKIRRKTPHLRSVVLFCRICFAHIAGDVLKHFHGLRPSNGPLTPTSRNKEEADVEFAIFSYYIYRYIQ